MSCASFEARLVSAGDESEFPIEKNAMPTSKAVKATAAPLARRRNMMIQIYDPRNLNQMNDLILSGKIKRIVVVGHNNTTPVLANLLIKQDKYKNLDESEYDKIWVIRIKRNKTKPNKIREEKVIVY